MANRDLFSSFAGKRAKKTDARNHEGAPAYRLSDEGALAQLAATGCLNLTFYASAGAQLDAVLELCARVDLDFVARCAVYARRRGAMKDMPALLCAYLAAFDDDGVLFAQTFDAVIDNGKMLRNFVQILRSGVTGRRSLGSRPKRKVRAWLAGRTDAQLFHDAVGNKPSLADVIKMVHPRPATKARAALYAYLIDKPYDDALLPAPARGFEDFLAARAAGRRAPVPDVSFQRLTGLDLDDADWADIARRAPWTMTRMNLNTFARHGVFEDRALTRAIARRLTDEDAIRKARAFPYQLLAAWAMASGVPAAVKDALEAAMEIAIGNVPRLPGDVVVAPDVSGSMQMPATGYRRGATSAVRCIDVAALFASALLRKNKRARVLPFDHRVVDIALSPDDRVMVNAARLARRAGGGTACSAPLQRVNEERLHVDTFVLVSDNESWADTRGDRRTETLRQWDKLKKRCPDAKLVCIDIQPYTTVQMHEREDVLHVGGFSDAVFDVVAAFARGELGADHWVDVIRRVDLDVTRAA